MKNYTLTGGLITGFTGIIFTAVTYFLGIHAMVSLWTAACAFLIFIGLYVFLGLRYRKLNGGYLTFKDAFALIFFMGMISSVLSGTFQIILYHVINPDLPGMMHDAIIQKTVDMMQRFNSPQEKIDETITKMQETTGEYSVGNQIRSIALSSIGVAILALIIGVCIKKTPPPFEQVSDTDTQ
ncbi:MAG TPA: DUF4199 domain-containing protein [Bacteroidia bacterium]|nr:DUF4199 domain-containing protein [Bacteroidia bacterium]